MLDYLRAHCRLQDITHGWEPDEPEEPERAQLPERCPDLPALRRWRREVGAGTRSPLTLDALWQAAAREQTAAEWWSIAPSVAMQDIERAREIIAAATRRAVA